MPNMATPEGESHLLTLPHVTHSHTILWWVYDPDSLATEQSARVFPGRRNFMFRTKTGRQLAQQSDQSMDECIKNCKHAHCWVQNNCTSPEIGCQAKQTVAVVKTKHYRTKNQLVLADNPQHPAPETRSSNLTSLYALSYNTPPSSDVLARPIRLSVC